MKREDAREEEVGEACNAEEAEEQKQKVMEVGDVELSLNSVVKLILRYQVVEGTKIEETEPLFWLIVELQNFI